MTPGAPVLGQLNLAVEDMVATLAFYRRLGLTIEAEAGMPHVAVELPGGLLVEFDEVEFVRHWDSGWCRGRGGGVLLGFWVPSPEDVDRTYADLVGSGYASHQQPYDAFWGGRYAIVDDPDGNGAGIMGPTDDSRGYWPPTRPPSGG